MALAPGIRLGAYEILAAIGAGGMGEVYKARDTRLDRTVAVKILPDTLAADPQLRERFDREARAISQLTHPHICTLYDIGEQQGTAFLVMEYLEGQTLEHRLKKGALRLGEALKIAIQIAGALTVAHRQGIVHRDLKPGNVMLTRSGAKLLDFGLAKTGKTTAAGAGLSMLPTTPPNLTAQGTILGTFQYMAPEQLEGHEADSRTDIFAFGAVLYEMLTGRRAFEGQTQTGLIAAILDRDPPPISLPERPATLALDHIVDSCLSIGSQRALADRSRFAARAELANRRPRGTDWNTAHHA
jgi:serine/threonine protein kinase